MWASLDDGTIAIIDKEQKRIVDVVDVKERVTKMTAGGGLLWALQPSERALIAIDLVQPKVVRVIEVGRRPAEVEWVDDHAWVTNTRDGTVTRISPAAVR